jgi:hypothetical protein
MLADFLDLAVFERQASDWSYRTPQSGGLWPVPISGAAAIGNLDGKPGADILTRGNDQHVYIVSGGLLRGAASSPMYSRQDLR